MTVKRCIKATSVLLLRSGQTMKNVMLIKLDIVKQNATVLWYIYANISREFLDRLLIQ